MEIRKVEGLPPQFAQRIAPLVSDNEWPIIADQIRDGRAELFDVDHGESVAVTRIEADLDELVLCVYVGKNAVEFVRMMCVVAKRNGLATVRYHSTRTGMARLLKDIGAVVTETVYQVTL